MQEDEEEKEMLRSSPWRKVVSGDLWAGKGKSEGEPRLGLEKPLGLIENPLPRRNESPTSLPPMP